MSADKMSSSSAGTAKQTPSFEDLTCTFVLTPTSGSQQVLSEVPKALAVDPSRQRRPHQKSKSRCENCRQRRIKCDEDTPCSNCIRRREHCSRPVRRTGVTSVIRPVSTPALLPSTGSTDAAAVNLLHMKLFHHFQAFTQKTLQFPPDSWERTFQLSFQFDFLMNAILCVAARHLATLKPQDESYSTAATSHVCRALSRFRHELTNNFQADQAHFDAFIATSVLVQYDVWANTDLFAPRGSGGISSFDPSKEGIFAFCSSLKRVLREKILPSSVHGSVLLHPILENPWGVLMEAAQAHKGSLAEYQDFFSYDRPLGLELLDMPRFCTQDGELDQTASPSQERAAEVRETLECVEGGYSHVITRLYVISSFLSRAEASPDTARGVDPSLLPELAKYMLTLPVQCNSSFVALIQQSDPHALLLLYHFYRAVRVLLPPERYWWTQKRATVLEAGLREWLAGNCVRQV